MLRQERDTGHRLAGRMENAQPEAPRKPLLRGWFHAVACVVSVGFTVLLYTRLHTHASAVTTSAALLYGASMIELYGVSATFHLGAWRKPRLMALRALDHSSIFIAIASAFTALCAGVAGGWETSALLAAVWLIALTCVVITIRLPHISRSLRVALYIALGCSPALLLPMLWGAVPHVAVVLLLLSGLSYLVGAAIYLRRSPDPWPQILGYHEVFHLLVVLANALGAAVVWYWLLPRV